MGAIGEGIRLRLPREPPLAGLASSPVAHWQKKQQHEKTKAAEGTPNRKATRIDKTSARKLQRETPQRNGRVDRQTLTTCKGTTHRNVTRQRPERGTYQSTAVSMQHRTQHAATIKSQKAASSAATAPCPQKADNKMRQPRTERTTAPRTTTSFQRSASLNVLPHQVASTIHAFNATTFNVTTFNATTS